MKSPFQLLSKPLIVWSSRSALLAAIVCGQPWQADAATDLQLTASTDSAMEAPNEFAYGDFEASIDATYGDANAFDVDALDTNAIETEVFRERYADGKVKIEREVALDAEGNYVNHGGWKMWDPTGLMMAEGQYDMGKRTGSWTRMLGRNNTQILRQTPFNRFKAPFVSQVNFTSDKMDGTWLIVDMDQRKCSQITLKDGVRHGMAITWMPNGSVLRQSEYDNGVPVGDVMQANNSTGKLERAATFVDGRRIT